MSTNSVNNMYKRADIDIFLISPAYVKNLTLTIFSMRLKFVLRVDDAMKLIRMIILLVFFAPLMPLLSGCEDDRFLEAIHQEEDFIAPYDVVISDSEVIITTNLNIADTGFAYTQADIDAGAMHPGDDGSYQDVPYARSFVEKHDSDLGGYIVEDNVTGLLWTKCSADGVGSIKDTEDCSETSVEMTRAEALTTCDNLSYAGFNDWRLPSLAELFTLLYFGGTSSYANLDIFPDTAISKIVDAAAIPPTPENIWGVPEKNHMPAYWTSKLKLYYKTDSTTSLTEYGWVVYFNGGGLYNLLLTNFLELIKVGSSGEITTSKGFVRCVRGGEK